MKRHDGNTKSPKGNRGRVGQKRESRSLQRAETKTDQNGSADGNRRAKAGSAFKERSKKQRR